MGRSLLLRRPASGVVWARLDALLEQAEPAPHPGRAAVGREMRDGLQGVVLTAGGRSGFPVAGADSVAVVIESARNPIVATATTSGC